MRLTEKDLDFLVVLKRLMVDNNLSVELKDDGWKRMVLRKKYGSSIESKFRVSRQGVRWRFHHIFTKSYVEAYLTILWVESNFGTHLREKAMAIAKDRYRARAAARENSLNR